MHSLECPCAFVLREPEVYFAFGRRSPAAFQQNFGYLCFTSWQRTIDELRLRGAYDAKPFPRPVYPTEIQNDSHTQLFPCGVKLKGKFTYSDFT